MTFYDSCCDAVEVASLSTSFPDQLCLSLYSHIFVRQCCACAKMTTQVKMVDKNATKPMDRWQGADLGNDGGINRQQQT